jgi:RimJ/RimL family protein N-acetyltransferase
MKLLDVYGDDIAYPNYLRFLFGLLKQRKPYQNISHKEMPTYEWHVHFVTSRPYKCWYLIVKDEKYLGAVYLSKDNEIGLFILEDHSHLGYGSQALSLLYEKHKDVQTFKANISPLNSDSIAFFANKGFKYWKQLKDEDGKIIQYTYVSFNPFFPLPPSSEA